MTDDPNQGKRRRRRQRRGRPDGEQGPSASRGNASAPRSDDKGGDKRRRRRDRGDGGRRARRDQRTDAGGDSRERQGKSHEAHGGERRAFEPPPAQASPRLAREDFDVEEDEPFIADSDESEPAAPIELRPDLPADPDKESDPSTKDWRSTFSATGVADLVGIKFHSAGKIYLYDSGSESYECGEVVIVDTDRGPKPATVAIATERRSHTRKQLRKVLRRPNEGDRAREQRERERDEAALQIAKNVAREHALPVKVFRCENSGDRAIVYFSSEGRVDARPLVRALSKELGCRVDSKQTGVRDEAKLVGGIGSCGQELCCSTWLPAFVPVSIKHAKDQGLVLNPTKVSGQCGRLKCCLVYEHATYAELRKGLPRLGKRVVTQDGEGRVVEVDVLRQRIRVSLVEGSVKVYGKGEVEPLFPSQGADSSKD